MYKKIYTSLLLFLLLIIPVMGSAQQYPVQVTPVVLPPYSLRLSDYATTSEEKMQLQILMTDLLEPSHQVQLKFWLESGTSYTPIAVSSPVVEGLNSITLLPGVPVRLSNIDIRPLFELQNLSGLSQGQYARALPKGMYRFCFQVIDALTQRELSQKSCATVYLQQYDPPQLNLPTNSEVVYQQNEIQNIVFQWMPRQVAPNTKYIFTLKEIWDLEQNPTSAFLSSRVLWQEDTYATTLHYGIEKTQLIPGKRYAWQVQAKSSNPALPGYSVNPADDNGVYKNNGLSEIFYFDYSKPCSIPQFLLAKNTGRGRTEIRWSFTGEKPQRGYKIQYRKKNSSSDWFEIESYTEQITIGNLEDTTEYEYRVGSVCGQMAAAGNPYNKNTYTYSNLQYFTTQSKEDTQENYQCGVMPDINISNKTPLQGSLGVNEVFMAGDFPVTVTYSQGQGGTYSGKGYIEIPYLEGTRIKVGFNNIQVNSDRKLISGVVETSYDVNESSVTYISEGIGETFGDQGIKEVTVNYTITKITFDETTKRIIIEGDSGSGNTNDTGVGTASKQELPIGRDYSIKDNEGNIWNVDEEGNITKVGKQAKGGASTPENTEGVNTKGEVTKRTAKGIKVTFENSKESQYAFEQPTKALTSDYKEVDGVFIPFKAVENKVKEPFIAKVEITDRTINADSLIFKTSRGETIPSQRIAGTDNYELTLKGSFSYAKEEVQAVIKQGDKYQVAGVFNLVHISPKEIKLNLIPTTGVNISDNQIQAIKNIYKKIAIDVAITVKESFDISPYLENGKLPTEDAFGDLSSYSSAQNAVINAYKQERGVELAYYIFVTDKASSNGQSGYMRLNGQFGFVYDEEVRTIAHELGHGALRLEHPFKQYDVKQGEVNSLMDYGTNHTNFIYPDWKQVNDPKFKIYAFQGQSDGEYNVYAHLGLTPDGTIFDKFYLKDSIISVTIRVSPEQYTINEIEYKGQRYRWNTQKQGFVRASEIIEVKKIQKTIDKVNIYRSRRDGGCSYDYLTIAWSRQDKNSTNIVEQINSHIKQYSEKDWKIAPFTIRDESCNKNFFSELLKRDLEDCNYLEIEEGTNTLRNLLQRDNVDASVIVMQINSFCVGAIRNLQYKEIEKLFDIVASQESIKEHAEVALLRLMTGIKTRDYSLFYKHLEANNNNIIKHLVKEMDDASIYFLIDKENYTNFIGALVWMFVSNPNAWLGKLPKDENAVTEYFTNHYLRKSDVKITNIEELINGNSQIIWQSFYYDKETGDIHIQQNINKIQALGGVNDKVVYAPVGAPKILKNTQVSPLSPVLFDYSQGEIQPIKILLDNAGYSTGDLVIVPAIFLQFGYDQIKAKTIEKSTLLALNGLTIYTQLPMVIQGATMTKRLWAAAEVAAAVGDIWANTEYAEKQYPHLKQIIDALNLTMGAIGIKNIGKGVVNFNKGLSNDILVALKENKGLRNFLTNKYLEWQMLIAKIDDLTDAEKQLIAKQEKIWKTLGVAEDIGSVTKKLSLDDLAQKLKGVDGWSDNLINELKQTFKATPTIENAQSWKLLRDRVKGSKKPNSLYRNANAIEALTRARVNPNMRKLGIKEELLANIKGHKGASYVNILEQVDDFAKKIEPSQVERFDVLVKDLIKGGTWAEGAEWTLRYMNKNANHFNGRKLVFELREVWSDAQGQMIRIADVVDKTDDNLKIFYEFKSVVDVPPNKFAQQFIKDLSRKDVHSLDQLKWIFDGNKAPADFKTKMIKAIENLELNDEMAKKLLKGVENPTAKKLREQLKNQFDIIFKLEKL